MSRGTLLSIRNQVLALSVLLLAIPYVGYRYVREMEQYLRAALEGSLLATAQTLAATLGARDAAFPRHPSDQPVLYFRKLRGPIELDGYAEDWSGLPGSATRYTRAGERDGSFRLSLGERGRYAYALVQVTDSDRVYSPPLGAGPERGDHLRLDVVGPAGVERHYLLATSAPGWVEGRSLSPAGRGGGMRPEPRLRAEWQEDPEGYTVELRLPRALLGTRMRLTLVDVDREDASLPAGATAVRAGSGPPDPLAPRPGPKRAERDDASTGWRRVMRSSVGLQSWLEGLGEVPGRRLRVLDAHGWVLADAGALGPSGPRRPVPALYGLVLGLPEDTRDPDPPQAVRLSGPEVEQALGGQAATHWYGAGRDQAVVSAAQPIELRGRVLGVALVRASTQTLQTVQRQALVRLFDLTLVVVPTGVLAMLLFATRLSRRIRRLRDAAEAAVDARGRVVGELSPVRAHDELGDLARGFARMVSRLRDYHRYLERLGGRLSHELRTPMAVVRSSLDNLAAGASGPEAEVFLERAREGVERLARTLSRMSEATRLEETLRGAEKGQVELAGLLSSCLAGYRGAWPERGFEAEGLADPVRVLGAPELLVQMLDKLVGNAIDFGVSGRPICIGLARDAETVAVQVTNHGPPLPETMRERLFESMVSLRERGQRGEPHLGLGLYIVRLIAEYHAGEARAENLEDGSGVRISVRLPRI